MNTKINELKSRLSPLPKSGVMRKNPEIWLKVAEISNDMAIILTRLKRLESDMSSLQKNTPQPAA